jgi:flagellar basal body P-ring protein FlgI
MEKKLDMIKARNLTSIVKYLNEIGVKKEDLVAIYPPILHKEEEYVAVFYFEENKK